ncbi:MAG TPA: exosortase H [Usitatibacter sp.]|nr:exosortase H [Usitatibacter sp.]
MLRFLAAFALIVLGLFTAELTPPVQQAFVMPWTRELAHVCAALITAFDGHAAAAGEVIRSTSNGFAVAIESGCNGVEASIVLVAAILAFRAPWLRKLAGVLGGVLAVQLANVLRVITLFYLGQWSLAAFEWAHLYVWQALIMVDAMVVWLLWLRWVRAPAPSRAAA